MITANREVAGGGPGEILGIGNVQSLIRLSRRTTSFRCAYCTASHTLEIRAGLILVTPFAAGLHVTG
jgi:uncharacterized membrane protein